MLKKSKFTFIYRLFVSISTIVLFSGSSSGYDDDRTGSPNAGGTCANCHSGGTGGGSITLMGAPTSYVRNTTYIMTLKVTDADMERAGFQITAVDASNNYAGTFIENPSAVRQASGFSGLTHGTPRTPVSGVVSWTIEWIAPSTGNAPVKFYYAGNAATGGGTGGDFIYTGSSALIPLPVSLSHFEAKVVQAIPVLTWATASEVHTKDFEMERSNDGKVFEKIGERKANGSNSNYSFSDENPLTVAYYRLKINDLDGKFEYSKVVSVESDVRSTVRVKPTFVNDVLTVEGALSYEIVDGTGRVLLQSIENQLNVQSLPQGFYVVRGRDAGGNPFIQKIIKN